MRTYVLTSSTFCGQRDGWRSDVRLLWTSCCCWSTKCTAAGRDVWLLDVALSETCIINGSLLRRISKIVHVKYFQQAMHYVINIQ